MQQLGSLPSNPALSTRDEALATQQAPSVTQLTLRVITTLGDILGPGPISLGLHGMVMMVAGHASLGRDTILSGSSRWPLELQRRLQDADVLIQKHLFFPRVEGKRVPEWASATLCLRDPDI